MSEVTRILSAIEQAAEALGLSVRTANRHWANALAWLYQQLGGTG